MAIYELTEHALVEAQATTFADERVHERRDIQRLLRHRIDVVAPDVMILAEEFGDWIDSRRRIDLLGIDRYRNLIVIELKRSEDGGHMELQALRYAAMVATMPFDQAVAVHAEYRQRNGLGGDARAAIEEFLSGEIDEASFAQDVRIVLVSAEFSKELTTAVMWLNDQGLDITCVRLRPYRLADRLLLDVQQIIPLPEAADYQVRHREKAQRERHERKERRVSGRGEEYRTFFQGLIDELREQHGFTLARSARAQSWYMFTAGIGGRAGGIGYGFCFGRGHKVRTELYIDTGDGQFNMSLFEALNSERAEIEAELPGDVSWEPLLEKRACRVAIYRDGGIEDDAETLDDIGRWGVRSLLALKSVFGERITRLARALPAASLAEA